MQTDQRLLISQNTTHIALCEDITLKDFNTSVTFVEDLESGCHTITEIELAMTPKHGSYDDLLLARMDTNATIRSGGSLRENNLMSTPILSEDSAKSSLEEISAGWKKLILVAKSIHRFRSLKVERISSQSGLVSSIVNGPRSKTTFPASDEDMYITLGQLEAHTLGLFRDRLSFFRALEVGGQENLVFVREMLGNDPKANLYEAGNIERLANKPDYRGYSPLYIACKNGNLELVKLLIQFQANPYQVCKVADKENESIIAVAARWSHIDLIKYLISDGFAWEEAELRKAYNSTEGLEIKKLIGALLTPKARTCWNTIFPCL